MIAHIVAAAASKFHAATPEGWVTFHIGVVGVESGPLSLGDEFIPRRDGIGYGKCVGGFKVKGDDLLRRNGNSARARARKCGHEFANKIGAMHQSVGQVQFDFGNTRHTQTLGKAQFDVTLLAAQSFDDDVL